MEIGIFDTSTHYNSLIDTCRIIGNAGFDLTIFTESENFDNVQDSLPTSEYKWILRGGGEGLRSYISRVNSYSENLNLLFCFPFYGPITEFSQFYFLSPSCPLVLSIFNVNTWTLRNIQISSNLSSFFRVPFRRLLLNRADAVVVEYGPIRDYLSPFVDIPVFAMTPAFFHRDVHDPFEDSLNITVPGAIQETRRDYGIIFDSLFQLPSPMRNKISIDLLGRPVGESGDTVISEVSEFVKRCWDINYYRDWIAVDEFNDIIARSDVLLSPLKRTILHDTSLEVYGQSKGSGVFADSIRFALPMILPDYYKIPEGFDNSILTFSNASELAMNLHRLARGRNSLEILHDKAKINAERYSLDRQSAYFHDILCEILYDE